MTCDRCGKPAAQTFTGLCGRCTDEVVDGMHTVLDQGTDQEGGHRDPHL